MHEPIRRSSRDDTDRLLAKLDESSMVLPVCAEACHGPICELKDEADQMKSEAESESDRRAQKRSAKSNGHWFWGKIFAILTLGLFRHHG